MDTLGMRHHADHVAALVADAGDVVEAAVGVVEVAQDDPGVGAETLERGRVADVVPLEVIDRDAQDLARLGGVTRARLTQIMNLTLLAPDIQEALLHLPRITSGRDPIAEPQLRAVAAIPDWRKQRRLWRELRESPEIPERSTRASSTEIA